MTPGRVAEAMAAAGTASLAQRRSCTSTGTRPRSTPTGSAATARSARRLRAVGPRGARLPARLERHLRARRHRLPADRRRPAPGRGPRTTASRPRSSTAPSRAGSTASRAGPRTAPATSSARDGFYDALGPLAGDRSSSPCRTAKTARHRCQRATTRTVHGGLLLGGPAASCARRSGQRWPWSATWPSGCGRAARAARRRDAASPAPTRPRVEAIYEAAAAAAETIPEELRARSRGRRPRCAASWARS